MFSHLKIAKIAYCVLFTEIFCYKINFLIIRDKNFIRTILLIFLDLDKMVSFCLNLLHP